MLASTPVKVLWSAMGMSAILVLVNGARRRCAGGQGAGDFSEGGDTAVAEGADQRCTDDRAVGVLADAGDLLGGGDADADACARRTVLSQAPDERARRPVELGALTGDPHRGHGVHEAGR